MPTGCNFYMPPGYWTTDDNSTAVRVIPHVPYLRAEDRIAALEAEVAALRRELSAERTARMCACVEALDRIGGPRG